MVSDTSAAAVTAPIPIEPTAVKAEAPSLASASGSMAIATLVSRITGFARQIMLVAVIGIGTVPDSYNIANSFPNIVYELLLGGVLASVVIPVLVRAQHEDADNGEAYTQRLLSVSLVVLLVGTVVSIVCTPLLTNLYVSGTGNDNPELTKAFTYLILPEILFYGIFGLLSGILNARHVFKSPAWAPVLNNVVMFVTLGLYIAMPGEITVDPVRMSDAKLLVLGIGTTFGVVAQALVLVPPLLRIGFRFRWRWGWDRRLTQFGRLSFWLVVYTLVTQVSFVVLTKVATAATPGSMTIYLNSWLLVQVPYGVLGVSLLTAIMPRMSGAAATGDVRGVVDNLSTGSRLTALLLIPICAVMTVLGPQIGQALFAVKHGNLSGATVLGLTLTTSSFGIVAYGITMLQLRVFYAMHDARTPTVINGMMVVVRVALFLVCPYVLAPEHVVYGLTFVNALSFVVGAIAGEIWLRSRLGRLDTRRVLWTIAKTGIASVWGAAAALAIAKVLIAVFPPGHIFSRAWTIVVLGTLVGLGLAFVLMVLLRVSELQPALDRARRVLRRA